MKNQIVVRAKTVTTLLVAGLLMTLATSCSTASKPKVNKIPAGQENSGFLKDYESLKPNPKLDEGTLTYLNTDAQKNLRSYLAIIVDPVEIYVATNADEAKVNESSRAAVANYFNHALQKSVSDAFPIVEKSGPLVLRLRAALVGIDAGGAVSASDIPAEQKPMANALNISKLRVEMELVDSETGLRIAAMVDKANLGEGSEIGAENFSRVARFAAARIAFDEWASRVRNFLDVSMELTGEDAERADKSYKPYGAGDKIAP